MANSPTAEALQKRTERFVLILLACLTLAIFSCLFAGTFWQKARDSLRPSADLDGTQTLELIGAPGEEVAFYLTEDRVLGDRWNTDGLKLDLTGYSYQVVPPHEQDWGEVLRGDGSEFKIAGAFTVPDATVGQTLTGTITGWIELPLPIGGGEFDNITRGVNIPFRLRVVTPEESEAHASEKQGLFTIYPILLAISAASLAIGLFSFISYRKANSAADIKRSDG